MSDYGMFTGGRKITDKERRSFKNREFHGEEFYLWALQKYEALRSFRNSVSKRRPTEEELMILKLSKPWEAFFGNML